MSFLSSVLYIIKHGCSVCGIYLVWSLVHLFGANLYAEYCAELSFTGYIYSLLYTMSPHCKALLYLVNTGNDVTSIMWKTLGSWLVTHVVYSSIVKVRNNITG